MNTKESPPENTGEPPKDETDAKNNPFAINFPSSAPLHIKILEKDKEGASTFEKKTRLVILGTIIVLIAVINLLYIQWNDPVKTQNIFSDLALTYVTPKYLSKGEFNVIDFTITNLNLSESFTGSITLIFHDPTLPIIVAPDEKLSMTIENLQPEDRISGQFKFKIPLGTDTINSSYYFQISKSDGTPLMSPSGILYKSNNEEFLIAPIPYMRTIIAWRSLLGWLVIGGGLGALISLRDELKKLFSNS